MALTHDTDLLDIDRYGVRALASGALAVYDRHAHDRVVLIGDDETVAEYLADYTDALAEAAYEDAAERAADLAAELRAEIASGWWA